MKDLVAKLMNHGFTEHQAQIFLGECYNEFAALVLKRFGGEVNTQLVNVPKDENEKVVH